MHKSDFSAWYETHREDIYADYITFLRFPSVSTDKNHAPHVRGAALWLKAYLEGIGLQTELWETSGHPVVFAHSLHLQEDLPTVLIYGHYDVQPVDPLDLWDADPFDPVIREGKIYARGASDNKGQCFYTIQAVRAYLELFKEKRINIKLCIEGEEEIGSGGTLGIMHAHASKLRADYLWAVDMNMLAEGRPAITLGVRGLVTMDVRCRTASSDMHSGMYGGVVHNPHHVLSRIIARMWDADGKVAIPGFYDDVVSMTSEDLDFLREHADLGIYEDSLGVQHFSVEKGYTPIEATGLRPCLEINGWHGGYTGEGFKTVIPKEAKLKLSCRLVPGQIPQRVAEQVSSFLRKHAPEGVEIESTSLHGAPAYRAPLRGPSVEIVASAYEEVFEEPCQYLLSGGSIPIVAELARVSSSDAVLMGVALTSDAIHAPNEHFSLERFAQGFLVISCSLLNLSRHTQNNSKVGI